MKLTIKTFGKSASSTINWTRNSIGVLALLLAGMGSAHAAITVDSNFEGGNGVIGAVDNVNNKVEVISQMKSIPGVAADTENLVVHCKITGFSTTRNLGIKFKMSGGWPHNPMYSYDNKTWNRMGLTDSVGYTYRTYTSSTIYISVGYPYNYSMMNAYINSLSSPHLVNFNIATSEQGRTVKCLKITDAGVADSGKQVIWYTGRQHAFETSAQYVNEGFITFLLSSDTRAVELRKKAMIYVVPQVDVDSAYLGRTGKDQTPVDINRCWEQSPPFWDAVAAIRTKMQQTAALNPLVMVIDSHNPGNDVYNATKLFYYVQSGYPTHTANSHAFVKKYNAVSGWTLPSTDRLVSGMLRAWAIKTLPACKVAITFEHGWHLDPSGGVWTQASYRTSGANIGKAIYDYLYAGSGGGTEVIVDNLNATLTGTWTASTFTPGYYGSNYLHDGNAGKGTKTARFTPNLPSTGSYQVFGRWIAGNDRASNVPFTITHAGGTQAVTVNQQVNGAAWVSLGTFSFNAGTAGNVLISNTGTTGFVVADAVRFFKP